MCEVRERMEVRKMKIYIVPIQITGFSHHNVAIRLREGEKPALFMQDAVVTVDGSRQNTDAFSSKSESCVITSARRLFSCVHPSWSFTMMFRNAGNKSQYFW